MYKLTIYYDCLTQKGIDKCQYLSEIKKKLLYFKIYLINLIIKFLIKLIIKKII